MLLCSIDRVTDCLNDWELQKSWSVLTDLIIIIWIHCQLVWFSGVTLMGWTGDLKVPGSTLSRGTVRWWLWASCLHTC